MAHASNSAIKLLPNKTLMPITEKRYTLVQFRKANSELVDFRCHNVSSRAMDRNPIIGYFQILRTLFEIEKLDCVRFYLQGK